MAAHDEYSLRSAVRDVQPVRTEILNYAKSGNAYWVEIACNPVFDHEGNVQRFISIERDITEQKQRSKLEQELHSARKLEAVGQLAAGIAHEINTPCQYVGDNVVFFADAVSDLLPVMENVARVLSSVDTESDAKAALAEARKLLEASDLDFFVEELPDSILQAKEGINRISEIVRAMKDFSHPGTEKQATDLNRSVENCLTVSRSEWKYVAQVDLSLDQSLPPAIVSAGEINQVCVNMIVNAAHAIADRFKSDVGAMGTIRVVTRCDGDRAIIEIGDNGAGMSDSVKAKIFDPFFTTKEVGRGTGQGLSIAYDIVVNRHSGTITVESEPGEGTRFIIALPLDGQGQPTQIDSLAA
ncbi:MAG: ATP-binding protein [Pseudomonadota bacterium]